MKSDNPPSSITNQQRKAVIVAVALTGAGKFAFMDMLHWKFPFIVFAIVAWTTYVLYQSKKTPGILSYWGFRRDNFLRVLKMVLPFGFGALVSCILIGWYRDTLQITWHIFPILLLYPIWGVIQQFLVIALVAGNLKDLRGIALNNTLIIFIAAALFGVLHYPWYWLIAGTFALALFMDSST